MKILIKAEIRKILFKKSILITWLLFFSLGTILITNGTPRDIYADAFLKAFDYAPAMGILMIMSLSGSYITEYNSNMSDLINTTKNGKKTFVSAKGAGAGISASLINLSVLLGIYVSAIIKSKFTGFTIPLSKLWYFKNTGLDLNVIEMMIIVVITTVIASFFFAYLCLYLSSISKWAAIPFVIVGGIMGISSIGLFPVTFLIMTPLWGMISSQLVRYNAGIAIIVFQCVIFIMGLWLFPKFTYLAFIKEK